ncbi:hypothetical protein FRC03_001062 [Tulasnella sp. 419]|nr:hypothetical protein FRC03_001062 [Tulasnella sp. 419]
MLSNPNPSALFSPPANPKHKQLSMPHYQPSPIAEAPPSNFNGSSDALSPEEPKGKETHPPISHHHFFHRRIHPATASAVTLPSSLSSASPHLPVTHMLPSTSDLTHNPSASPVPTKKARRASRVALTGIRDILRSLKKSATSSPPPVPALPQPSQSPVVEKAVVQTSSPPSVANTSSVPSSRPFTPAAGAVFSPDSSSHDIPNKKTSIRGSSALHSATVSNYPYSSQSAKKSPKRPSLASIFRIGSSKTRKQGGVTPSAGTQSGHVSSAADTTTEDEDYSDWDRMDSVSDIDVTAGNPALDNEHVNASNVPTVKRKRPSSRTRSIVPSSFSPPPSAPGSSAQSAPYSAASASQSSLSLTTSPRRMPLTIAEDTSKPLPINPHGSRRRVSSKGAGGANGRIPPTASLPSLSSHFPPSSSSTRLPQLSHQTDPPTTGTPLAPATPLPDIKLALTPENIRPLLEYTREVLFRLNECMVTLEGVNNTVRAAEAGRRSVESGAH